ncbi:unnamed protein product, partial [Mesorhabditis belari]|uniref:TGF-beta family profile domain-containing protein n=1 Tax=Mesorhabditis belari TaxID=2138241 RepID=A0AAF3J235_9BILA
MKTLYGQIDDERMLAQNHLEMLRNANTIMSFAPKKTFSIGDYTGISFNVLDFAEILPQYAEIRLRFAHAFDGEILLFTKKNDAKGVIFAQDFSIFGIVSYEGISPKNESSKGGNVPVNFDPLFAETEVNEKGCRRKGLYVNFNDLGWQDWVIAPEGFQLFLCDGGCSFPLHSKMNATNHAIVQTLVHLLHPQRALPPRCAPSKLSQQKIIFIDDSENVVLKRYQDMIVLECGCQ